MGDLYRQTTHWLQGLDRQEWLMVLIGAVIVGFLALRGMGSRKEY